MSQLCFATTAMHTYSHEWACQLIYNPCITSGLGLSDGEGTERLWSQFIKLIGIEWVSSVSSFHNNDDSICRSLPSANAASGFSTVELM